jgi:hypothetical protein
MVGGERSFDRGWAKYFRSVHFLKRDTELFWGLEKFKLLLQELFPVGGDEFKRGVLRVTGLKFTSNWW